MVLVCNCPPDAAPDARRDTEALWRAAVRSGRRLGSGLYFTALANGVGLVCVDAWSRGRELPRGQGVGGARALGADLVLRWMLRGELPLTYIHFGDADVTWRENYFRDVPAEPGLYLHGYEYAPAPPELREAVGVYDAWLWYHAAALAAAGSPYAYAPVGSTISVHPTTLTRVRGVPRRAAGEDFHLAAKARKVGPVMHGRKTTLVLLPRRSSRTPFGTGPALAALAECGGERESPRFLAPHAYRRLGELLDAIRRDAPATERALLPAGRDLVAHLQALGLSRLLRHLDGQNLEPRQRLTAWMTWLDGLKTLRLLHRLRDEGLSSQSFSAVAPVGMSPVEAAQHWRRRALQDPDLTRRRL